MRASAVRSLLVAVSCALLVAWTPAPVSAVTCDKICTTPDLWGYGGEDTQYASCPCEGDQPGARSGPNNCGCGECYQKVGTKITGFGKQNGVCQAGSVDCGDCDVSSSSGSKTPNTTTTTAPPSTNDDSSNPSSATLTPSSPTGASSSAAGNSDSLPISTSPPSRSESTSNMSSFVNATLDPIDSGTAPTNASGSNSSSISTPSSSNDGLATWQIALIICSCVLVIAVVMMTITSCYCKARNSMKENMQNEDERHEYEGYWNPNGGDDRHNEHLAQSAFGPTITQGGRSSFNSTHSRPNSTKNVPYSEPTYVADDRIGGPGRSAARKSLGSNADLPGVYQPFPQRPTHDVGSRNNIAIEL